jgi:hypothetical protein
MFSESACQVSRRWDDVGSFYTRLFGVVYVTRGDFHNGSEKGTASVHQILRKARFNLNFAKYHFTQGRVPEISSV